MVAWPGGKKSLLKHLLPLIPKHECYVECFGGGGALLFAKPPSRVEVYNDINGGLVNLMRMVKHHGPEVLREMEYLPNSRELFKEFIAQPGTTEIQRAVRFLLTNRLSFGGMGRYYGSCKVSGGGGSNTRQSSLQATIHAVTTRLDGVSIEQQDWRALIKKYDAPGTLFFFDPPYTECATTAYEPWSAATMKEFRENLDSLQGQWLLTVNDSQSVRDIFLGYDLCPVQRANGIERHPDRVKNAIYKELIIRRSE